MALEEIICKKMKISPYVYRDYKEGIIDTIKLISVGTIASLFFYASYDRSKKENDFNSYYLNHPETKLEKIIAADISSVPKTDLIGNDGEVYVTINYNTGKVEKTHFRTEKDASVVARSFNFNCKNAGVVLTNPVLGNMNLYTPEKCGFPKKLRPLTDIEDEFYGKYANYLSEKESNNKILKH